MHVTMATRIVFNNGSSSWMPETETVDDITFVKIDFKDRAFFRFCTGNAIKLGKQYEESRYLLACSIDFVKARSDACQAAFEQMQRNMRQEEAAVNDHHDGDERKKERGRKRPRKARDDDALTVGAYVTVTFEHGDDSHDMKARFGMKKSELWIEANVANIKFVMNAMHDDYTNGRFADTRPRGPCFRRQRAEEAVGEEIDHEESP